MEIKLRRMVREWTLNFSALGWQPKPFLHLDVPITEQALHMVIKGVCKEKAPDPDGFIGPFFSACWEIIRDDLV
jgi:hypothetical protein